MFYILISNSADERTGFILNTQTPATTNKIPARIIAEEGLLPKRLLKIDPKDKVWISIGITIIMLITPI